MRRRLVIVAAIAAAVFAAGIVLFIPIPVAESQIPIPPGPGAPFRIQARQIIAGGVVWDIIGKQPLFTEANIPAGGDCTEHWDKIMFGVVLGETFTTVQPHIPPHPVIVGGFEYDVKVVDDPTTVADLRQKVVDELISMGYKDASGAAPTPVDIRIHEVAYAISTSCSTSDLIQGMQH